MTVAHEGFFGMHVAEIKVSDPSLICPRLIAGEVLERLGVGKLPDREMTQFTQDLRRYNLQNNPGTHDYEKGVTV